MLTFALIHKNVVYPSTRTCSRKATGNVGMAFHSSSCATCLLVFILCFFGVPLGVDSVSKPRIASVLDSSMGHGRMRQAVRTLYRQKAKKWGLKSIGDIKRSVELESKRLFHARASKAGSSKARRFNVCSTIRCMAPQNN